MSMIVSRAPGWEPQKKTAVTPNPAASQANGNT